MVTIDGQLYLDGGAADSIPLYPCHEKRPPEKCGHSYQKSGNTVRKNQVKAKPYMWLLFKKYPNLLNTLLNRYQVV